MLKRLSLALTVVATAALPGCVWQTRTFAPGNQTQVELHDHNFEVVKTGLRGEEMGFKVLFFGASPSIAVAMDRMRQAAELQGKSRAFVNVTMDETVIYWLGLVTTDSIIVSGDVVEFKQGR